MRVKVHGLRIVKDKKEHEKTSLRESGNTIDNDGNFVDLQRADEKTYLNRNSFYIPVIPENLHYQILFQTTSGKESEVEELKDKANSSFSNRRKSIKMEIG